MNNIDALIAQLCPDGMEFRELGEMCEFMNGKGHEKHIIENGKYIVVNSKFVSTDGNVKKYSDQQISPIFINDILLVMSDLPKGKALAKCFVVDRDDTYTLNQRIGALSVKDGSKIDSKFLYNILNRNKQLLRFDNGTDQTNLRKDDILKISIPIPPLPIQQEIVTILDKFTQLQAELQAELQARRAQYEYYRNDLLNFEGKEVEWKPLGEVCDNIISGKNTLKANEGDYPVYGSTGIIGRSNLYVYENDCLLVARVGANAGFVYKAKGKYDVSDNTLIIRPKEIYNMSFAYFQLLNLGLNKFAVGGGQPLITAGLLKKLKIPLPPLAEQNRIVAILDKFDKLVNDISEGLPAEIQARRKQYEYYRGKLLDFKSI